MALFRALYNVTVFPLALMFWWLRRRSLLRRARGATLRLTRMPPIASSGRRRQQIALATLADDLERAAADPLLRGLFVSLEGFGASAGNAFDLAALLDRFSRSGKRVDVFVERADWRTLMVGRSAARLTTDSSGPVMVHGIGVELPFMGELLERYGVAMQVRQRGEFKGMMEPFVRREASPALLTSLHDLVNDLFERAAHELARRPGLDVGRARAALEEGPYTVRQALDRQLVDAAGAVEDAESQLADACAGTPMPTRKSARRIPPEKGSWSAASPRRLPSLRRSGALRPAPRPLARSPRLAFVPVTGLIVDRPMGLATGRQAAIATELVPRLRQLADTRGVEAIVLVVDSRGGTASASDMIWNAARYALARKPVVAWMRGYAASGGYYVAVAAERILASPFTITGSIGVIASKPNIAEAAARMGVRPVAVGRGRGAALFSPFRPFTDEELAWLDAHVEEAYRRFTSIVAEARRLPADAVEQVARGRVWTGPQALERGLIDGIGAYPDVVAAARELAGIPAARRHDVLWAGPREGLLQMARRLSTPRGARGVAPELEPLIESLLLAQQRTALCYMPLVWE